MLKRYKIMLLPLAALLAVIAVMVIFLIIFSNSNFFKTQLENIIYKTTGLQVSVKRPIGLAFFPGLRLRASGITVSSKNRELVRASDLKISVAIIPLARKIIHLTTTSQVTNINGFASGRMFVYINLTMRGSSAKEFQQTAAGELIVRGHDLTFYGRDLDTDFSHYEKSQNFNLFDAGAYFFLGPVGIAVTKGYSLTKAAQVIEGKSAIVELYSAWRLEGGIATAVDVAMATKHHRLALKGSVDLINEKFNALTLALVDSNGRAIVKQQLNGPFRDPTVKKPALLMSLAGPAVNLFNKGVSLFASNNGEIFYNGTVKPPLQ
jgi:hypothetical protein